MNTTVLALGLALCTTAFASPRLLDQDDAPRMEGSAREKLTAQLTLLQDERPNLRIGKGLLIGGGVAVGVGALVGAGALALFNSANHTPDNFEATLVALGGLVVGAVGVVILIAGGVLLIAGLVCVLVKLHQQSSHEAEIKDVRERLDALDREAPMVRSTPLERRPLPGFVIATF
jgi:hypothetical protein